MTPLNERKRVFHLIKGLGRGGAEKLLCDAYLHADKERFHYGYGYFLKTKDDMVAELEDSGAEVHCFGASHTAGMLPSCLKVARLLRRWRADLVHCHLPLAGVVGRIAGRVARIPVVYTEHNIPGSYAWPTRRLNLATWKMQHHVFAVSDSVGSSIEVSGARGVPVQVVPNGVCTDRFSPATTSARGMRNRLRIADDAIVVGTVAGFRRHKRLDIWLEAAAEIRRHNADVCFLLVGDGTLRPEIEAAIDHSGLEQNIRLVGMQNKVAPFLATMDIYMMSSDFEGMPVALLEAMSMQLPVVATPVGGIPEVVTEGHTGVLVQKGDATGLASAVLGLIGSRTQRQAMGNAGRMRVQSSFSLARNVREMETVYSSLLLDAGQRVPQARVANARGIQAEEQVHPTDRHA